MSPELTVVIPVFNEAASLPALHREFTDALSSTGRSYELILVDDGSTDGSFEQLKTIQASDKHVRVIQFRRNFGQTAAFAAGFAMARGALIITADADLQNDPKDIPMMLDKVREGADIVCGWRKDRKDAFLTRRLPSGIANRRSTTAPSIRPSSWSSSVRHVSAQSVCTT